jgi:hypothetical protein
MLGRWAVHRPNCRFATKKLARVRRFDSGPSEPIVFLNKAGTRHHGQPRVFGKSRIDSGFVAAYDAYADPHGADDGTRRAPGGAAEARPHRTGIQADLVILDGDPTNDVRNFRACAVHHS